MKILLVSATEHELDLSKLKNNKQGVKTDVLIGGIGIASTSYHTTRRLTESKYDVVIQVGIAGSFSNDLSPGETVFIAADTFGDSGIKENGIFQTLFSSGLVNENDFPFINGWLINPHELLNSGLLKKVKAITVNKITDDKTRIEEQKNIFNPQAESMEGAAFHYVCLHMAIPFLQIRSISNMVGERDKSKWKMREAISNLNNGLNKTIQALSQ